MGAAVWLHQGDQLCALELLSRCEVEFFDDGTTEYCPFDSEAPANQKVFLHTDRKTMVALDDRE